MGFHLLGPLGEGVGRVKRGDHLMIFILFYLFFLEGGCLLCGFQLYRIGGFPLGLASKPEIHLRAAFV